MLVDCSFTDPVCDAPLTLSCSVFRYSFLTDDVLTLTEREPVYNIEGKIIILLKESHERRQ